MSGRLSAKRKWTEQELEELRQLAADGWKAAEIARRMGRRVRGIRAELEKMAESRSGEEKRSGQRENISNRGKRWTDEEDAKLREWFYEGRSLAELAEHFRRTPHGVWMHLQKLGIMPADAVSPYRAWTDEEIGEMHGLALQGVRPVEIAVRLNRAEEAVSARLFYLGVGGRASSLLPEDVIMPEPPKKKKSPDSRLAVRERRMNQVQDTAPVWTQQTDDLLRRLHAEGMRSENIASAMGLRERSVRCRMVFLGLADHTLLGMEPMPPELAHHGLPWYPEEIEELQRMHEKGRLPAEMAARLCRSEAVVRSRLAVLQLTETAAD